MNASRIIRLDARLDSLIASEAAVEKLAGGFTFTEGPVWVSEGYLLFSDIPENTIYRWNPGGTVSIFRKPSGYDGSDASPGAFIGSNGLTLDAQGRLTICEHGNRRVTRLERDGSLTVLCSHYQGKRLNSPNDAVYKSDGALYFTDPPYGLPKLDLDPAKELDFNGIYRLKEGELTLLYQQMSKPNGLAFSPDEKYLYVANSDPSRRYWNRFPVLEDGTLGEPEIFADLTADAASGVPDGMKLDELGNLYCTGPGGVNVFAPDGQRLGVMVFPEQPANLHWGDEDSRTLYVTARTGLYRIRMKARGIRP
ncbi:MAG: SMP-30/gluconolactonase/LRE family protein [Bryobacteraceae bacterium]|nr:SMP-30/gluconolactonase/LRE family protein [Bryobacteraceae bacterium]MDW8378913.1 SMP-30/gluconolactonase/LRE family protein [Bryobacterales bacterium]